MTGKEFLEFYEQINEITGVEWMVSANEYFVKVMFTIDGERLCLDYPNPMQSFDEREMNYVAISMLVNKCIRDLTGQNATMLTIHGEGILAASTITASINYARYILRMRNGQ